MHEDILVELRRQLDIAIETKTPENYARLSRTMEAALGRSAGTGAHGTADGNEAGRIFDAIDLIWSKATDLPGKSVGGPAYEDKVARLLADMLAVQRFTIALGNGDLSHPLKATGAMAGSLKALQANLRHLTWQTQAVARGDFTQRVDFMGEFSESFNAMVMNLAEMRDALERSKREIELRVEERTGELMEALETLRAETEQRVKVEEQLRQSHKMEALGTLAGGVAHDFNNILAGIIGFTEMALEETPPDSPLHRKLTLVLKGAMRGRGLVKQILTFSRRTKTERKEVAAGQVIEEALKLLGPAIPSTVEIRKKPFTVHDRILADQVQLHQIIMNLCTNAAHSMRERGGVLEVSLTDRDLSEAEALECGIKPGPYVELSVGDTGCGIAHDLLEKIFDPFFTTKKAGHGTGMGLSVVHGIVKGHEGHIAVRSTPGHGSVFCVYLPRVVGRAVSKAGESGATPGRKARILFVDDEDMLVEMNSTRLRNLGHHVVAHTSGAEAMRTFEAKADQFDLVITDYTMPHMTGIDLAKKVKEIRPDIPVILCSGFNETITPAMIAEAGIRAFTSKTVSRRELAEIIERTLEG